MDCLAGSDASAIRRENVYFEREADPRFLESSTCQTNWYPDSVGIMHVRIA